MREQRWPWLLTAVLLLASGAARIWSLSLHWLPCRGDMLNGSILRWYAWGSGFSDGCLYRMNGGLPFPSAPDLDQLVPWASELSIAASALTGMAWLALVLGLRWSRKTKAVAALPALAALVVVVVCAVALVGAGPYPDELPLLRLRFAIDWSAVVALIMIMVWQPEMRGRRLLRLLVVLWGVTAFGFVHEAAEWIAMGIVSVATWDVPPGTAYLTGATLIISGLLTLLMTLRPPQTDTTGERTRELYLAFSAERLRS